MDAILLPGAILPARLAYEAPLGAFDRDVTARAKELEVYRASEVPLAYGLDTEVAGVDRVAAEAGFERFHLVRYSAGGASSLAYALTRPGRLRSLTLADPAWAGIEGRTPEEAAAFERFAFPTTDVQAFERPVLFVLGGLSNPAYYRRMAQRLATSFPDFRLEVFDGRHHFDPPHRAEPERYARLLEDHWRRAEARSP